MMVERLTRAAMAVQSSAPIFPPRLRRAHTRNAVRMGQMTTKTAAGMYTRCELLSLGLTSSGFEADIVTSAWFFVMWKKSSYTGSYAVDVDLSSNCGPRFKMRSDPGCAPRVGAGRGSNKMEIVEGSPQGNKTQISVRGTKPEERQKPASLDVIDS